ncbi:MAG: Holliday junction DNA helicase RuvA [Candidatus Yanofskybacteria bacterium RIFCSPLOWO2_02_FULL_45_18]|uniref:Holliday junction branch migration complex subunit RuvA n=1 Tax=Candidatus Yanofskybacteria bacterium RIFCSPLOWO2_02_FULL_45_18 TaxID=1802707 RepID=A0A1F8H6C9_9BACT|nr:MAG: Holliday junction DNA helicase RuvA [Candidatus Yanofskybacteria bacterium RIFCSPLOWO2_02_FULL_45_18]
MISFLEGKIEYLADKYAIINAGGIGYRVYIIPKLRNIISKSQFPVKQEIDPERSRGITDNVRLHIHSQLNMREGTFDLYGFDKREDLDVFNLLISVSGIGPKMAMAILTTIEPQHLKAAVVNEDSNYLKKVSGLGPKTAQRLILELKNKVDHIDLGDMVGINLTDESNAVEALVALGYGQYEAKEVLKTTSRTAKIEERVREALKMLGKK